MFNIIPKKGNSTADKEGQSSLEEGPRHGFSGAKASGQDFQVE